MNISKESSISSLEEDLEYHNNLGLIVLKGKQDPFDTRLLVYQVPNTSMYFKFFKVSLSKISPSLELSIISLSR